MAKTPELTIPDDKAAVVLAALEWKYKAGALDLLGLDTAGYAALTNAEQYTACMRVLFKELHREYVKANPPAPGELDVT